MEDDSLPARPAPADALTPPVRPPRAVSLVIGGGVLAVLAIGGILVSRAESGVNKVALASAPKPVTVVSARATHYREKHTYIGTLRPWVEANVGPQFVSAYVDTVLVRPGAAVARNEVLATLDCRYASASNLEVAAQARAIDARQKAVADESSRLNSMLDGGFVSPNEAEQIEAQSASEQAQLAAQRAKLASTDLTVNDCVMRAPFDGEVSVRSVDPGAFAHPGTSIVTVVDRDTVRMTFEVPESDFDSVGRNTPVSIQVLPTGATIAGAIARRSPAADPDTRTIHVEVDLDNADRRIPVNTTGVVEIQVGAPRPAVEVPLVAASMTDAKATLFVVDGDVAHSKTVEYLGEEGDHFYVKASDLAPGSRVVTEGRSLLSDGDRVAPTQAALQGAVSSARPASAPPIAPEAKP